MSTRQAIFVASGAALNTQSQVKNLVLIASGKGGVGKSTVAVNLALALSRLGRKVGLLDADIYGPSIPTLLGPASRPGSPDGKHILPIDKHGLKVISMGYMVDQDTAMIWRGPMLAGAVAQFVSDVVWGELDDLVLDLPPGTGDIQLTLSQKFKVSGAVLVTTPQQVAIADVVRAKAMFDRVHVPILGLIENMSYFVCDSCDKRHEIFATGGGKRAADALDVPFMGEVPLEPVVRQAGDAGTPLIVRAPESVSAKSFSELATTLVSTLETRRKEQQAREGTRRGLPIVRT